MRSYIDHKSLPKLGFHFSNNSKVTQIFLFMNVVIPVICTFIITGFGFNIWISFYTFLKCFLFYNGILFMALSTGDQTPIENFWNSPNLQSKILQRRILFVMGNMGVMVVVQMGILFLMRYLQFPEKIGVPRIDHISTSTVFVLIMIIGHILTISALGLEFFFFIRLYYLKKHTFNGEGLFVIDVSKILYFGIAISLTMGLVYIFSDYYINSLNNAYIYVDVAILFIINLVLWFFGYRVLKKNQFDIPEYIPKSPKVKIEII